MERENIENGYQFMNLSMPLELKNAVQCCFGTPILDATPYPNSLGAGRKQHGKCGPTFLLQLIRSQGIVHC